MNRSEEGTATELVLKTAVKRNVKFADVLSRLTAGRNVNESRLCEAGVVGGPAEELRLVECRPLAREIHWPCGRISSIGDFVSPPSLSLDAFELALRFHEAAAVKSVERLEGAVVIAIVDELHTGASAAHSVILRRLKCDSRNRSNFVSFGGASHESHLPKYNSAGRRLNELKLQPSNHFQPSRKCIEPVNGTPTDRPQRPPMDDNG